MANGYQQSPKIPLLKLWERTSGKGNRYLSGFMGDAQVIGFIDADESEARGCTVWQLYAQESQRAADARKAANKSRRSSGSATRQATTAQAPSGPSGPSGDDVRDYDDEIPFGRG